MSETIKAAVLRAVLRLLEPLARLLIEAGVGVGEFHQLAKTAYARAGRDAVRESRPNFSRISVLTGIPRGEVADILRRTDDTPPEPERGLQRAERVLHGWWENADYTDQHGQPLRLPLRGPRPSFTALVRHYAGDPRVATVLQELIRVRAVHRLADGRLEVLSRSFVTARWDSSGIETVGEQIRDLIDTLVYNLQHPSRPRYARFVQNAEINPAEIPLLLRDITQQLDVVAETVQDNLSLPKRTVRAGSVAQAGHRICVGLFVTDEPSRIAARAQSKASPTKRARKAV